MAGFSFTMNLIFLCIALCVFTVASLGKEKNSKPVDSYCISLMIFSGRADPVWTIQCSTHHQLCADLKRSPSQRRPPSRLGYKGFRCSPSPSCYTTLGFVILGNETKALQHRLLDSAPPDVVVDGFKTRVHEWINSQ